MKQLMQQAIGGKVLLNIQARSVEMSEAATDLLGRAVLIGVMAKAFPRLVNGVSYIQALQQRGVLVSAGLGDGSANQWEQALQLAVQTQPVHLNQIFPAAALSRYTLRSQGAHTLVNAMIRPTGRPGFVNIGTGPFSELEGNSIVSIQSALAMMKDTGICSIKFFPIRGLETIEEVRAVARAAADAGMMLEPTGGITVENVKDIVQVCLEEGVSYVMPHLYGSLINPQTGDLDMQKLETAARNVMSLFGQ